MSCGQRCSQDLVCRVGTWSPSRLQRSRMVSSEKSSRTASKQQLRRQLKECQRAPKTAATSQDNSRSGASAPPDSPNTPSRCEQPRNAKQRRQRTNNANAVAAAADDADVGVGVGSSYREWDDVVEFLAPVVVRGVVGHLSAAEGAVGACDAKSSDCCWCEVAVAFACVSGVVLVSDCLAPVSA